MREVKISTMSSADGTEGIRVDSGSDEIISSLEEIPTFSRVASRDTWSCFIEAAPVPMNWLVQSLWQDQSLYAAEVHMDPDASERIFAQVRSIPRPVVHADGNRVIIQSTHAAAWDWLCRRVGASRRRDGTSVVPMSRVGDLIRLNATLPANFAMEIRPEVEAMVHAPLPAPYDGSDRSLRHVPVDALSFVSADAQSWSDRKSNPMPVADKLRAMGDESLHDLLTTPPLRYIDRSNPQGVRELLDGERATIIGTITDISDRTSHLTVLRVEDREGAGLDCQFFNGGRWLRRTYRVGDRVVVNGVYHPWISRNGTEYPQMSHPTIDFMDENPSPIIPIYHQSAKLGVSNWLMSSCVDELVERLGDFTGPKWLESAVSAADLSPSSAGTGDTADTQSADSAPTPVMSYGTALKVMHLPSTTAELEAASRTLSFCELVEMLVILEADRRGGPTKGVSGMPDGSLTGAYVSALPYSLTGAQTRSLKAIGKGMAAKSPMRALLVGDVGSGKTTVIHLAALKAIEEGHQAVICAPTEILATQLYDVFAGILKDMDPAAASRIHTALHVRYHGKGAAARRRATMKGVADGSINLVFGTHSVLSPKMQWHDLGFVGIDEQHKFGAVQRTALLGTRSDGRVPDMLMQTATPIPRSVAQLYYGDVSYLRLDEMPGGRARTETRWIKRKGSEFLADMSSDAWTDVVSEARKGHGTFVICPMVSDSPKTDAASVKRTFETVRSALAPQGVRCAMVYGSQKEDEQARAISGFRDGSIQVLVASSVVEVGVSCKSASRMIILDANRFGLASLHQIRGRIGRGSIPGVCWLVGAAFTDVARKRMEAITSTTDGWELSRADLRNRGTGTLLGDSQSGTSDFRFADLATDSAWVPAARAAATAILKSPDRDEALADSRRWFGMDGSVVLS